MRSQKVTSSRRGMSRPPSGCSSTGRTTASAEEQRLHEQQAQQQPGDLVERLRGQSRGDEVPVPQRQPDGGEAHHEAARQQAEKDQAHAPDAHAQDRSAQHDRGEQQHRDGEHAQRAAQDPAGAVVVAVEQEVVHDAAGGHQAEQHDDGVAGSGVDAVALGDVAVQREGDPEGEAQQQGQHDHRGLDEAARGGAAQVDELHGEQAAEGELGEDQVERVGEGVGLDAPASVAFMGARRRGVRFAGAAYPAAAQRAGQSRAARASARARPAAW